jgi:transcriptional regulator with XRE-family HTH domain
MKDQLTLRSNIILLRKLRGYSQEKVAFKLFITQACYNKLEIGQTKITDDYTNRIAIILDVSIDILSGKDLKQEFLKLLEVKPGS